MTQNDNQKIINLVCTLGATVSQIKILATNKYISKKEIRKILNRQLEYLGRLESLSKRNYKNTVFNHKTDFPKTFNDLLHLSRVFTKDELISADKEGLIELCIALKEKELRYDIERNEANSLLQEAFEFIDKGACMQTIQYRIKLEDKIKEYFENR